MENSGNTKLWDQSDSNVIPLRRPKGSSGGETTTRSDSTVASNQSGTNIVSVSNSRLSADAAEFYPSGYCGNTAGSTTKSYLQDRLNKFKKPSLCGSVQDSFEHCQDNQFNSELLHENNVLVQQDIERLQHIISTLTCDPGQFDDLLELFMDTFKPYFNDITVISIMAKMIFQQAVNEQNFRYTAARLCCMVDQNCPLFRSELHLICDKMLKEKKNLQGLTLFLAELYSQLHYENLYGKYLLTALQHLINTGDDINVKCACQALKLTGGSLGLYNSKKLDELFSMLQNLRASLSPSVANCLNSVIKLKDENWGMSNTTNVNSSQTSTTKADNNSWVEGDNTVFYNPADGLELSADERMFLADHLQPAYTIDDEDLSDPDELCDPEPEMDEEIQAAFKEFLRLSKK